MLEAVVCHCGDIAVHSFPPKALRQGCDASCAAARRDQSREVIRLLASSFAPAGRTCAPSCLANEQEHVSRCRLVLLIRYLMSCTRTNVTLRVTAHVGCVRCQINFVIQPLINAQRIGTPDHTLDEISRRVPRLLPSSARARAGRTARHRWSTRSCTCASRMTGRRRLSGSWAACRPAPLRRRCHRRCRSGVCCGGYRALAPLAARRAAPDRRAGAPSDPPVVAAAARGIIALQAGPALPRHVVRLRSQAGRQESRQAGQVNVGEAQQGHIIRGADRAQGSKKAGGCAGGRIPAACGSRRARSSCRTSGRPLWLRRQVDWRPRSPVVLPAQVLGPIGRAKPCDMILLLVLRGGLEAHILAGV